MKVAILIFCFITMLFAEGKMEDLYKKDFLKACEYGSSNWRQNEDNEKFMMMFGNACLKSDYIDYLAVPAARLGKTKESREAAALYSAMLTKKRLLLMALMDKTDISYISMPKVDHILSVAFDKMASKELKFENGTWSDKNKTISIAVIDSPKEKNLKTLQITDANGTKRIMFK